MFLKVEKKEGRWSNMDKAGCPLDRMKVDLTIRDFCKHMAVLGLKIKAH